jgi:putative Mn2+ efflux pump MntP
MEFGAILMLAVGLAMDATAVAAARGFSAVQIRPRDVVRVALFFGGFQAVMPLIGYVIGQRVGPALEAWDHWIVFALLSGLGLKMLFASAPDDAVAEARDGGFGVRVLTVLAVATSIDALAVGFTLPMMNAPLTLSLVTIGVITALLSGLGVIVGRRFGAMFGQRLDAAGGLILIALGTKVLIEHLHSTP